MGPLHRAFIKDFCREFPDMHAQLSGLDQTLVSSEVDYDSDADTGTPSYSGTTESEVDQPDSGLSGLMAWNRRESGRDYRWMHNSASKAPQPLISPLQAPTTTYNFADTTSSPESFLPQAYTQRQPIPTGVARPHYEYGVSSTEPISNATFLPLGAGSGHSFRLDQFEALGLGGPSTMVGMAHDGGPMEGQLITQSPQGDPATRQTSRAGSQRGRQNSGPHLRVPRR